MILLRIDTAPPSVNSTLGTGSSRRLFEARAALAAWKRAAGQELLVQRSALSRAGLATHIAGVYTVRISLGEGMSRADIDNLVKPVVDLCHRMGFVEDDREMQGCLIFRSAEPGLRVLLEAWRPHDPCWHLPMVKP